MSFYGLDKREEKKETEADNNLDKYSYKITTQPKQPISNSKLPDDIANQNRIKTAEKGLAKGCDHSYSTSQLLQKTRPQVSLKSFLFFLEF